MKIVNMLKKNKLLILILVAAAFIRLWKLSEVPVSLFGDELDVGYQAYSILKTGKDYYGNFMPIHFHSIAEWRTPLYLYSAVPTVAIWGISPLGVRLPAAFFGVIGVWGMYLLVSELQKYKHDSPITDHRSLALIAAGILTLSPWHIQYSRAGFEVTELLAFLLFGLYFFFRSLRDNGKYLWLSVILLVFTPWIYSTTKLFTPIFMFFIFLIWIKEILKFPKKQLIKAGVAGLIIGLPIAYSTIFGGGAQRARYTSVFTNPTVENEVGVARLRDAAMRGNVYEGMTPNLSDRVFHNKFVLWGNNISENVFESLSLNFLFVNGDPNLRHSIKGMGLFYMIEAIPLIFGLILFFTSKTDQKIKLFITGFILLGLLPAALTRDGGHHSTRLILILPPLIFLISYGLVGIFRIVLQKSLLRNIFVIGYVFLFSLNFLYYQHLYWVHNPWDSERFWHAGFGDAIHSIKSIDSNYNKVIISMSGEPAWIFFAGWYEYPPEKWQADFPIDHKRYLEGFGDVSYIDKFYFGSFNPETGGIYDLPDYIDNKTLYLANSTEIGANLIMEPDRTPPGLTLIRAIPFPSGEPAFYLFSGTKVVNPSPSG